MNENIIDIKELEEKVKKYESLLHQIQMYREVSLNGEKLIKLLDNICKWSYSHRAGNGMLTEEQQSKLIKEAFDNLDNV